MSASILVATPHAAFGELLRISLEDSGQHQVRLAQTAREARAATARASFQLAILDSALADEPFVPFCMDLLEQQPGIRLIVVPPENNPNHPALGGLIPHGYLSRPFYLPDLVDTIARLLADREKQLQVQGPPPVSAGRIPASVNVPTMPPWLQEPLTLRGYLASQLTSTQALAAMIGLHAPQPGGANGIMRASAGKLSEDAAQELVNVVFRYWNSTEKTDLMRFVRLSTDKTDYLVYATQITGDMVLILAYDTTAPLSQIRPQTKAMAQAMATLPPADYRAGRAASLAAEETVQEAPAQEGAAVSDPASIEKERARRARALSDFMPPDTPAAQPAEENQPVEAEPEKPAVSEKPAEPEKPAVETPAAFGTETSDEEASSEIINLTALLGTVPSPDPERQSHREARYDSGWTPEQRSAGAEIPTLPGGYSDWMPAEQQPGSSGAVTANSDTAAQTEEMAAQRHPVKKRKPATGPLNPEITNHQAPATALPVDFALPATPPERRPASLEVDTEPPVTPAGVPVAPVTYEARPPVPAPEADLNSLYEPPVSPLDDTRPSVVSALTSLGQLEPASPALSLLNYTCVLVPRLPQHYLTGELADKLAQWVQQLCLAFGWRLEGIAIRPEYLQWTVQVAPAISPGNLIRIVRQRTSQHIFGSFPHLAGQNPSGDFWAIGYLIVSGAQPPSAQLLRDYIAQTRKRQGIIK